MAQGRARGARGRGHWWCLCQPTPPRRYVPANARPQQGAVKDLRNTGFYCMRPPVQAASQYNQCFPAGGLVGFTKRLLEEEMARGYHTSEDTVCADCFRDDGIRDFIQEHLQSDSCSVCGRTATEPIAAPADDVLEYFLETLHEYYESAEGNAPFDDEENRFCVETWDIYDLLFGELGDIAESDTLNWLHSRIKDGVTYCRRDWQIMSAGEALTSAWERFCHAVKHETRFLFFANDVDEDDGEPYRVRPAEMLDELGGVIRSCGLIHSLSPGRRMFRVRGHENGKAFTAPLEVGPPPEKYANTAGRMNAPGIVVMYASFDRDTALEEATGNHTEFSVAEFETSQRTSGSGSHEHSRCANYLRRWPARTSPVPPWFCGGRVRAIYAGRGRSR